MPLKCMMVLRNSPGEVTKFAWRERLRDERARLPLKTSGAEFPQRPILSREAGCPLVCLRMCFSTYIAASAALSRLSLVVPSSG